MATSNRSIRNIVFLGAGNVAAHLAKKLHTLGFNILQIYSRHGEKAAELADTTESSFTSDINGISLEGDMYILAVADDAILVLADQLRLPGKLIVHTSGSVPMETLRPISDRIGVLYPLQTFTKGREVEWEKLPLCLEAADDRTYEALEEFAQSISPNTFPVDSRQRQYLHLSAVLVNNFVNHLLVQAGELTEQNGLPFAFLKPLIEETLAKAFEIGPAAAQTGPAARGDESTLERHRHLLQGRPLLLDIYNAISKSIREKQQA